MKAETAQLAATLIAMTEVLGEVAEERYRQETKWGQQNHPNGTGPEVDIIDDIGFYPDDGGNVWLAECAKLRTDALTNVPGRLTYAHILTEEWAEAMAEEDPERLRVELIQVAAVAAAWVEKIDRDVVLRPGVTTAEEDA